VTLSSTGTYYWQVAYSGDTANGASVSVCGSAANGGEVETVTATTKSSTTTTTSLSGGGQSGASISVPADTAVTDSATLTGTGASTATGTVTYTVYSDSGCTTAVNSGTPETITTPGTLPSSAPVTLSSTGTYYWQASYSGDTNNAGSTSPCGSAANGGEVETVATPAIAPTKIHTGLSTGTSGTSGTGGSGGSGGSGCRGGSWCWMNRSGDISVDTGTAVTDSAFLWGSNASTATGSVTYTVYSDSACTTAVNTGTPQTITTPGTLPDSNPVTLTTPGTYYWQASYTGDTSNAASTSKCGSEVETVTLPPTKLTTTLLGSGVFGGGKCWWLGDSITVFTGTSVSDSTILTGPDASSATGSVTYTVYSNPWNQTVAANGGTFPVTAGIVPDSNPVTLTTPGTYYWQASYTGDSANAASTSRVGSEVEIVISVPQCKNGWSTGWSSGCKSQGTGGGNYGGGNGNHGGGGNGGSGGNGNGGYGNGFGSGHWW
jgi:hypothetical protein